MRTFLARKVFFTVLLCCGIFLVQGCSSPTVRYGDSKAVETVTTEFGSSDLQQIAEAMARSMLMAPAVSEARDKPTITVSEVKNKTTEYIDTRTITDKIRTQMTKSGRVRFAVSIAEMQTQVDELKRQNQTGLYSTQTRTKMGNMQAAKYRVEGSISSIVKQTKDVKDVFFIFHLSLIDTETGLVEWEDEKEIRKTATR
jgi:penicillin-binding protein activator